MKIPSNLCRAGRRTSGALLAAQLSLAAISASHGDDKNWISPYPNAWTSDNCWSLYGKPGAQDNVMTPAPGAFGALLLDDSPSVANWDFGGSADWTATASGGARVLTISGTLNRGAGSGFLNFRSALHVGATLSMDVGALNVHGELRLGDNTANTQLQNLTVTGATSMLGGQIRVNAANAKFGVINNNGGKFRILETTAVTSGGVTVSGLTGTAGTFATASAGTTAVSGTLTIDVTGSDLYSYSGTIVNTTGSGALASLALVKAGSGTQILSGSNTYSGGTTVAGGALLIDNAGGSGVGTGAVVVRDRATFGGKGKAELAGANGISIETGGTLLVGDGTAASGTLTIVNNLTIGADARLTFVIGDNFAHSTLARSGTTTNWTFPGNQSVFFLGTLAPGTYSNLITGLPSSLNVSGWKIANAGWSGTFSNNAGNLSLTVNPKTDNDLTVSVLEAMKKALDYIQIPEIAKRKPGTDSGGGYVYRYDVNNLTNRAGEAPCPDTDVVYIQPPSTPTMGGLFVHAYKATKDFEPDTERQRYLLAAKRVAQTLEHFKLQVVVDNVQVAGWHFFGDYGSTRGYAEGALDFTGQRYEQLHPPPDPVKLRYVHITFDDKTTQSCVDFLLDYVDAVGIGQDCAAENLLGEAVDCMARARYPNGAWPQRLYEEKDGNGNVIRGNLVQPAGNYPIENISAGSLSPEEYEPAQGGQPKGSQFSWSGSEIPADSGQYNYSFHFTLNDGVMRDCIQVMLHAKRFAEAHPEWTKWNADSAWKAAREGGNFLINAQFRGPGGVCGAWGQQYDYPAALDVSLPNDRSKLVPCWARKFEIPAVSSAETAMVVEALIDLYLESGMNKYFKDANGFPVEKAITWLDTPQDRGGARLYPEADGKPVNLWARYYGFFGMHTNQPIGGSNDSKIIIYPADGAPLPSSWVEDYSIPGIIAKYNKVNALGRVAYLDDQRRHLSSDRWKELKKDVTNIINDMDSRGRWVSREYLWKDAENPGPVTDVISTAVFVRNMYSLCSYLERVNEPHDGLIPPPPLP